MNELKNVLQAIKQQDGLTLIEVLIFITILSIIFVAIAFSTTQSLKRAAFNQQNIIATRLAEEAEEWLSSEKETSWSTFQSYSDTTYCLNSDIPTCDTAGTCWDNAVSNCSACDYGIDSIYKRCVILTTNGSRVDADITVDWQDGPNTYSVPLETTFSRWE